MSRLSFTILFVTLLIIIKMLYITFPDKIFSSSFPYVFFFFFCNHGYISLDICSLKPSSVLKFAISAGVGESCGIDFFSASTFIIVDLQVHREVVGPRRTSIELL